MTVRFKRYSVEELCTTIASGGTPVRSRPEYYFPADVPWIKTGDLKDSYIDEVEECISTLGLKESSAKLFPPETVVVAMYGATAGRLGIVRTPAASNQAACGLIADSSLCDSRFLFYLLLNDRQRLESLSTGAAQQNLSVGAIRKLEYDLPELSQQRAIAEVLGALDDKIAANRKLADTAGALLAARFSALQLDEDYGDQVRLDTYFELNPKCAKPIADEPTYLDMQKLPTSEILISDWDKRLAKSGTRFMNGDTLLARITPCLENRKVGYVDFLDESEVALGSTEYIVFRARPGVPKELAFFLATSARFRATAMQHMVGTSGRQRLSASDVAGFTLRKIEDSTLAEWGAGAAPLLKHLGSLRDENRTLASLRDALLPRLMSGELRVPDGERLVENLA